MNENFLDYLNDDCFAKTRLRSAAQKPNPRRKFLSAGTIENTLTAGDIVESKQKCGDCTVFMTRIDSDWPGTAPICII